MDTTTATVDSIEIIFNSLAEKMGVTVEYLWPVLIKQASVDAITAMIFLPLVVIILACVFIYSNRIRKDIEYVGEGFLFIICFLFAVVTLTTVTIFTVLTILTALINPEFYALQKIINMVKM